MARLFRTSARTLCRWAFTLVELLVVIAVIAILIALLLPAVQKVREAANRTQCANNLKQLGLACHNWHNDYQQFPPGIYESSNTALLGTPPPNIQSAVGTWQVLLLPYIEQQQLYQMSPKSGGFGAVIAACVGPNSFGALMGNVKTLQCPSMSVNSWIYQFGNTFEPIDSYAACFGTCPFGLALYGTPIYPTYADGIFNYNSQTRIQDITDGTSNTILLGEKSLQDQCWTTLSNSGYFCPVFAGQEMVGASFPAGMFPPINYENTLPCTTTGSGVNYNYVNYALRITAFGSQHPGGANFCLADGSVRFISQNIPYLTAAALATKAGGEVISNDY